MSLSETFMREFLVLAILPISILSQAGAAYAQAYSDLWGRAGEKWRPNGRLPDFSYAGYHCGESAIPKVREAANVRSFGAKGDGKHDDTQAFLDAIDKTDRGAIYVPPGRYKITKIVDIQKSNVVLRGAGPDKSILFFPRPLNDIKPDWGSTTAGRRTSNYSWSGGLVWIKGDFRSKRLADVTADAKRGDTLLRVSSTERLKVGQRVEVFVQDDDQKTLTSYLYSGDPGDVRKFRGAKGSFIVTLTSLTHDRIAFDRPLRFDVKLRWKPQVRRFAPTVREVGIEDLCFEFPATAYGGHFTERGYNALAMSGVADCWVNNILILNADSGMFVNAKFCTIAGVKFESKGTPCRLGLHWPWCPVTGHHGIVLGGTDNLFTGFRFDTRFIHDLGVSCNHAGNVFSNGSGIDLNFDHHRRAPYENLFTDIDAGKGMRMWSCGGGRSLGKHCGARGTFWNIRAERPQRYPGKGFGPVSMNLVAVQTDQPSEKNPMGRWFEAIDPPKLEPQNLHEAQLVRRLAGRKKQRPNRADAGDGE
jgi:hypothetical protein